ncbi:hypothetical protein BD410DRAFT_755314, partial [Rickenella mellea]
MTPSAATAEPASRKRSDPPSPAETGDTNRLKQAHKTGPEKVQLEKVQIDVLADRHDELDKAVISKMRNQFHPSVLLVYIVLNSDGVLDQKFTALAAADELLDKHPALTIALKDAWDSLKFQEIRELGILQQPGRAVHEPPPLAVPQEESERITELSWQTPFKGDTHRALWQHAAGNMGGNGQLPTYAKYTSLVQSSGMGKSRAIDEMSKEHFVIPINLRAPRTAGFPAPDTTIQHYLVAELDREQTIIRMHAFLIALFEVTTETVIKLYGEGIERESLHSAFRNYMTEGQTMSAQGKKRSDFYKEVEARAIKMIQNHVRDQKAQTPEDEATAKQGPESVADEPRTPEQKTSEDMSLMEMAGNEKVIATHFAEQASPMVAFGEKGETTVTAAERLIGFIMHGPDYLLPPSPTPAAKKKSKKARSKKAGSKKAGSKKNELVIVLAFDEAHTLTLGNTENKTWSAFSELRRALRTLKKCPLFSYFLSTTGKVSQFSSSSRDDWSNRVQKTLLGLIEPFTELGFDQLAEKLHEDNCTLEYITSMDYWVTLGRPLFASRYAKGSSSSKEHIVAFAIEKLLNGPVTTGDALSIEQQLACLAQRLPILFKSTTYTDQEKEMKQVEAHMRVCLKVDPGFASIVTISPSEPILSEAACALMTAEESFDPPKVLQQLMGGFSIHQGDRGELIVMLLLTLARDAAYKSIGQRDIPLCTFLEHLFSFEDRSSADDILNALPSQFHTAKSKNQTLGETFADSRLHFTHIIQVHEKKSINRQYLWKLLLRGAAVLCANGQAGVDGALLFTYKGNEVRARNIGLLLWQSKNDPSYTNSVENILFDAMDPYKLGIYDEGDEPIPVIRVVFALAAIKPSLNCNVRNAVKGNCTAYDVWCSGLSSSCLKPITPESEGTWSALLQASHGWKKTYSCKEPMRRQLRMAMNPGAATDAAHWANWS